MQHYYAVALALLTAGSLHAAPFDAGSDGSLGHVVINVNTNIDLPPDGILKVASLTVNGGRVLGFNKNPLNTPVRILSQGDVLINGQIVVSGSHANGGAPGRGGPGGFDGGFGGYGLGASSIAGDGTGPGRGRRIEGAPYPFFNSAAHVDNGGLNTNKYGSALIVPLIGGSGGAGQDGNPG